MTRLELLELWIQESSPGTKHATLRAIYEAAPASVQNALVARLKSDLASPLLRRRDLAVTQEGAATDALIEIQAVQ